MCGDENQLDSMAQPKVILRESKEQYNKLKYSFYVDMNGQSKVCSRARLCRFVDKARGHQQVNPQLRRSATQIKTRYKESIIEFDISEWSGQSPCGEMIIGVGLSMISTMSLN